MMRSIVLLGPTLLVLAASCGHRSEAEAPKASEEASPTVERTLSVEQLMRDADVHKGEIVVEGVVSAVSESERRVALIDAAEYEHCGVVTCAEYTLPVRWTGELPVLKERLRVRGSIADDGGKFIFVAVATEKVPSRGEQ